MASSVSPEFATIPQTQRQRRDARKFWFRFYLAAGRELAIRAIPILSLSTGVMFQSLPLLAVGALLLAGDLMRHRRESFYQIEGRVKTAIMQEIDPMPNELLSSIRRQR